MRLGVIYMHVSYQKNVVFDLSLNLYSRTKKDLSVGGFVGGRYVDNQPPHSRYKMEFTIRIMFISYD